MYILIIKDNSCFGGNKFYQNLSLQLPPVSPYLKTAVILAGNSDLHIPTEPEVNNNQNRTELQLI